ncbi:MAG: DUF885 domain-containing protein [Planctomycetota bacterium]
MRPSHVASLTFAAVLLVACSGIEKPPATTPLPPPTSASHPGRNFAQLVDDYLDYHFRTLPAASTGVGYHRYDDRFVDFREASIQKTLIGIRGFEQRLTAIDRNLLNTEEAADYDILVNRIAEGIYLLEELRPWASNPMVYVDEILFGLDELVGNEFRPLAERLELIIAREKQIGFVLAAARDNLVRPHPELIRLAIDTLGSALVFLAETLPEAVSRVQDADLLGRFRDANREAIEEVKAFYDYLDRQLQSPRKGSFTMGADALGRLLELREMVDLPVANLLEIAEQRLEDRCQAFPQLAEQVGAGLSPEEALAVMREDHGEADSLLDDTAAVVGELRRFVEEKGLVSVPTSEPLRVAPMPPYQFGLAIVHYPGPLEPETLGSYYYYVSPVERDWSDEEELAHLQAFNRPAMIITSIHETYPGHYVQSLHVRRCPSKIRRVFQSYAFVEGWAHYTEGLMLDQGLYAGNPDVELPLVKLALAHDELLRLCRVVAAIRLHAYEMTLEEAQQLFVEKGFQDAATAEYEARKAIADPMVMSYTLGRLLIEKLRDDYAAWKGESFSLREFHDDLLSHGAPPVPILRRLMLPIDLDGAIL